VGTPDQIQRRPGPLVGSVQSNHRAVRPTDWGRAAR
jgi:hypothetical protein